MGETMKILMTAGMHGNEQDAVLSMLKYREMIQERDDLDLEIDFVIMNKSGLFNCTRETLDNLQKEVINDPNRMFEPAKSVRDTLSFNLDYIKSHLKEYEVVIDLHNSEDCATSVVISNTKYARNYIDFCDRYNIDYIAMESNTPTLKQYANETIKIPAFTVELGGMNSAPFSRQNTYHHAKFIDMLVESIRKDPDLPDLPNPCRDLLLPQELYVDIHAHMDGIVEWLVDAGSEVKVGDVIAKVREMPDGPFKKAATEKAAEEVRAPINGILVSRDRMVVKRSESIGWIQPDQMYGSTN